MAGEVDTPSGVAGRYANALFELALEEKALEKVEQDLNRFAEALDAVEDLRRLVKSPVFSAEEQERAIAAVLAEIQIEGLTANFLKLVAKNRRLFAAPDMIKAFRALLARHRGLTSAEVTSAVPLAEAQLRALQAALKAALRKDVRVKLLTEEIDQAVVQAHHLQVTKSDFLRLAEERFESFQRRRLRASNG